MGFNTKYTQATKELDAANIWRSNSRPPLHRLARKVGFNVRPPHYNSFIYNTLSVALGIALMTIAVLKIVFWSSTVNFAIMFLQLVIVGLLIGIPLAAYYGYSAKKNKLSAWGDL